MFLFRFSKACSTDTSDRSCNQPSLQRLKNVFCKIREMLVFEILNNCFEADVLKSMGRPAPVSSQASHTDRMAP